MISSKKQIRLIALVLVLALSGVVFAQDSNTASQSQPESKTTQTSTPNKGRKIKVEGIVVKRNGEMFTVRTKDGQETDVVLTAKTKIKVERKGLFRADRTSDDRDIARGLRLKVNGKGNDDGQVVAEGISFDEQDLNTAQALASRVDPVETMATSAEGLAESNTMRLDGAERRLDQAEQNSQRLSGQVEELSSVASAAGAAAEKAQASADQAQAVATIADERISSLDNYECVGTLTVHFKPGSARLSSRAKAEIDEVANGVGNLNGWVLAVVGYADSRGNSATNRSLSDRRAKAVIDYLVTKHGLPLRRVVQPYGYGELDPVATNRTREGRSLNRRAEISVLLNKGISSPAGSEQSSAGEQISRQP